MKHTYTEEKKEKIAQMVYNWLRTHNAFSLEHVYQTDDCQIESIELVGDLADIKDVTED